MMLHKMGLHGDYFLPILEGKKQIEVRLYDEKRQKIKIGDLIEFTRVPEQNQVLIVQVMGIRKFATFKEMYQEIPFEDFGCKGWTLDEMLKGIYEIYSEEQEMKWGTVALTISYLEI